MGDAGRRSYEPTLLLVEDEARLVRHLERALGSLCPVRTAATLAQAVELLEHLQALVGAVIDIGLPDGSGLDLLPHLNERRPRCPILVLTGHWEPELARQAQLFGAEFLPKPADRDHMAAFTDRILSEFPWVPAAHPLRSLSETSRLTARELEIAQLAVYGLSAPEIAGLLGVSSNTLKTHVRSLLRKTAASSLGHLTNRLASSPRRAG